MNKKVLTGIVQGVVVIAVAIATVALVNSQNTTKNTSKQSTQGNKTNPKDVAVKACDLLTLDESKQLFGASASKGDLSSPGSSEDVVVDTCSYTNAATNVPDIRVATLMVRTGVTQAGKDTNKAAFEKGSIANREGMTAVAGYGDKAFWDPEMRQLSILKGDLWLGITYGDLNPSNNTLEDAKKVADLTLN